MIMTRQEKRESFKTYMGISHIGTWGFMICIILVGLTSMIKFALKVINIYYSENLAKAGDFATGLILELETGEKG